MYQDFYQLDTRSPRPRREGIEGLIGLAVLLIVAAGIGFFACRLGHKPETDHPTLDSILSKLPAAKCPACPHCLDGKLPTPKKGLFGESK